MLLAEACIFEGRTMNFSLAKHILDDSSDAESPAVEQMLDEILLDDAVDDMPLEDIEDILDEPIADEMPEDNVQETEPDMDPMEYPIEIIPYTL